MGPILLAQCAYRLAIPIMPRDANNVLLGGGVRVRVRVRFQRKFKGKIKGITKPLMASLDSTQSLLN